MIPPHLQAKIAKKLADEIGYNEKVGEFIFIFSALNPDRDVEYALEELKETDDPLVKKAINMVLECLS